MKHADQEIIETLTLFFSKSVYRKFLFFGSIIIKILQFLTRSTTARAISRAIMGKPLFEMVIGIFPYSTMISCGKESFAFLKPQITYKKNLNDMS